MFKQYFMCTECGHKFFEAQSKVDEYYSCPSCHRRGDGELDCLSCKWVSVVPDRNGSPAIMYCNNPSNPSDDSGNTTKEHCPLPTFRKKHVFVELNKPVFIEDTGDEIPIGTALRVVSMTNCGYTVRHPFKDDELLNIEFTDARRVLD